MSLEICILASGSSGNSAIVRTKSGTLLIDAGIGPRSTTRRLIGTGASIDDIRGIVLTHLDRDHFNRNWLATIVAHQIRIYCAQARVFDLLDQVDERLHAAVSQLILPFDDQAFQPMKGLTFMPIKLVHDRAGSHGFVVDSEGIRLGYATDLGRVPPKLMRAFVGLDLLAIESNYDPDMQRASGRPVYLQQRITSGRGHLSNQEAFDAICAILDESEQHGNRLPTHIVLLHRSRQCNCPDLVRKLFQRDQRICSRLTLAEQYTSTKWLGVLDRSPISGEQLQLTWGQRKELIQ